MNVSATGDSLNLKLLPGGDGLIPQRTVDALLPRIFCGMPRIIDEELNEKNGAS